MFILKELGEVDFQAHLEACWVRVQPATLRLGRVELGLEEPKRAGVRGEQAGIGGRQTL